MNSGRAGKKRQRLWGGQWVWVWEVKEARAQAPDFSGSDSLVPEARSRGEEQQGRLASSEPLLRSHVLWRLWVTRTPSSSSPGGVPVLQTRRVEARRPLTQKARALGLCRCPHGCGQCRGDLKRGRGAYQCQRTGARVNP